MVVGLGLSGPWGQYEAGCKPDPCFFVLPAPQKHKAAKQFQAGVRSKDM